MALNFRQFHNIQISSANESQLALDKNLKYIVKLANTAKKHTILKKSDKMRNIDDHEFGMILKCLYERNYFSDLAPKLFAFLNERNQIDVGATLSQNECYLLLGILLGASIKDQRLLRYCVVTLL